MKRGDDMNYQDLIIAFCVCFGIVAVMSALGMLEYNTIAEDNAVFASCESAHGVLQYEELVRGSNQLICVAAPVSK